MLYDKLLLVEYRVVYKKLIQDRNFTLNYLSVYVCETPPLEDLNPSSCPPHLTNTYTYGVTVASRMCNGNIIFEIP